MCTDHSSIRCLTSMKEPEGQLARCLERLSEYHFEIIHRAGQLHGNADGLSRRPCRQSCPCRLPSPPPPQLNVSHQAVLCDLDSDIHQAMLSPVGVERHPAPAEISLVGVDRSWWGPLLHRYQKPPPLHTKAPLSSWRSSGTSTPPPPALSH